MTGHAFGSWRINNFQEWIPAFHHMGPEIHRLTGSTAGAFNPSPRPSPRRLRRFFFFFFFLTWAHVAGLELLILSPLPPKLSTTLPLPTQILSLPNPARGHHPQGGTR